jgi:hypothetical protein
MACSILIDRLILRYGALVVGEITDAQPSDNTWFGRFRLIDAEESSTTGKRVRAFIGFSEAWHVRLRAGRDAEASEFDSIDDLLTSGLWVTETTGGTVSEIDAAPVFVHGEITWRYRLCESDRPH